MSDRPSAELPSENLEREEKVHQEPRLDAVPESSYDIPELSVVIVRTEGIETMAQHRGDNALEVPEDHYRGFRGALRSMWHAVSRPVRRANAVNDARERILQTQNIFGDPARQVEHEVEMSAIRERFMFTGDELIHRDAGEEKLVLTQSQQNYATRQAIIGLLSEAIQFNVTEEQFREQQRTIFRDYELADDRSLTTDNLWCVVVSLRNDPNYRARLAKMNIVLGTAQLGVRTQTKYGVVDRILHRLEGVPVLNMVSPAAVATAAAVVTGLGISSAKAASKVLTPVLGSAAVSGLAGYIQANEAFQRDLFNDRRDAAMGQEFGPNARRRQQLMARRDENVRFQGNDYISNVSTRFCMMDATVLRDALVQQFPDPSTLRTPTGLGVATRMYEQAMNALAEADARVSLSNTQQIDLIRYSSEENIEQERLQLQLAIVRSRRAIRAYHAALLAASGGTISVFNPDGDAYNYNPDITVELNARLTQTREYLTATNIEPTTRHTNRVRRGHARRAAAIAAGSAVAFAGVSYGISQIWNHFMHVPNLGISGTKSDQVLLPGSRAHVSLLNGQTLEPKSPGFYNIVDHGEVKVDGISFNPDGTLTADAEAKLSKAGYFFHDKAPWTETVGSQVSKFVSAHDYPKLHANEMVTLQHLDWANNNTAKFDLNELRLDWGGANNTGIVPEGYAFSVGRMQPGDSFLGAEHFNPKLHEKMYVALSITQDSQNQVFTFPVDANGQAIIPHDSDAARMLFEDRNGHAVFKGNFAHAMYFEEPPVAGSSVARGVSLATHVGSNTSSGFEKIVDTTEQIRHAARVSIVPPLTANEGGTPFVMPFPLFMRKELERQLEKEKKQPKEFPLLSGKDEFPLLPEKKEPKLLSPKPERKLLDEKPDVIHLPGAKPTPAPMKALSYGTAQMPDFVPNIQNARPVSFASLQHLGTKPMLPPDMGMHFDDDDQDSDTPSDSGAIDADQKAAVEKKEEKDSEKDSAAVEKADLEKELAMLKGKITNLEKQFQKMKDSDKAAKKFNRKNYEKRVGEYNAIAKQLGVPLITITKPTTKQKKLKNKKES